MRLAIAILLSAISLNAQSIVTSASLTSASLAGGGTAAAAYTPAGDASVIEWLKADSLSMADGTAVSSWTAATGLAATQASGANQGVFTNNAFNSLPAIIFSPSGSHKVMATTSLGTIPQPFTVWIVYRLGSVGIHATWASTNSTLYVNSTVWDMYAGSETSLGAADTSWHIAKCQFNGASSKFRLDHGTDTTCSPGAGNLQNLAVGNFNDNSLVSDAMISEVIVQNAAPGNEEGMWTYLHTRWPSY